MSGLAILGVVASHAAGWAQIAWFSWASRLPQVFPPDFDPYSTVSYYILLVIRQISVFSVPFFLFSAGFFIAYAVRGSQTRLGWKTVRSRLVNLLIPYTIWTIFIFLADFLINHTEHDPLTYLGLFLGPGADGPYFFIPLLCYLTILTPIIFIIGKKKPWALLAVTGILQFGILINDYVGIFIHTPIINLILNITPTWLFIRWAFFYVLGLVFSFQIETIKNYLSKNKFRILAITILLGILSVIEPELIFRTTGIEMRFSPATFSTNIYSVAFILLALAYPLENLSISRFLCNLGNQSFGIYLLHMQLMTFISRLAYHFFPILLTNQVFYQPVLWFFGLGIPLLAMKLVSRSPIRKYYRYIFG